MQNNKPLLSDQSKVVYEADSLGEVTDGLIESFEWSPQIPAMGLVLRTRGGDPYALLERNVSGKYSVRVLFGASPGSLRKPQSGSKLILAEQFPDKRSLVDAYVETQREYFYKPWSARISMSLLENTKAFAEKYALPEASLCFKMNGRMVGMAAAMDWKDWFGAPVKLLAWVWFSSALTADERREAHYLLIDWLERFACAEIICAIDSYNLRSLKFFGKIGFSPKCLIVDRAER